jgi:hypothetical protein
LAKICNRSGATRGSTSHSNHQCEEIQTRPIQ